MKRVMVFGVFDGIHEGHRAFFSEARKLGDYLIVAVARDEVVQKLKNHPPKYNLVSRVEALRRDGLADEAVAGDADPGIYEVVKQHKPDIIALGYDQDELKNDLEKHVGEFEPKPKILILKSYGPDKYHSSVLNHK